ncbi:MAG: hypothetical protein AB7V36_05120 [Bacteroidales bacterium]
MKTKSIRNIFVLVLLLVFVVACRYEDGPLISLRYAETRLVGTWRVTGFEKNGISVLEEWRSQYDWRFTFFDRYSDRYFLVSNCDCYVDTADVILTTASGHWILDNDNESEIGFGYSFVYLYDLACDSIGVYPLISGHWVDFDIMKLSNSKLWLNSKDSLDNDYLLKFEKE